MSKRQKKGGFFSFGFYSKNQKGLSAIVATILLIGLSLVVVGIVWSVVNGLVRENVRQSEACFGVAEKVQINSEYTCYNETGDGEIWISVDVGELENLDDIAVEVVGAQSSIKFEINDNPAGLQYYNRTQPVLIPGPGQGRTYIYPLTSFTEDPEEVRIAPIVDRKRCDISDTLNNLDSCSLLA